MKIREIVQKLGTTPTSLGRWIDTFGEYFSAGSKQRHRDFTEDDLDTLATVAKLSRDGLNYEAIREKLSSGYRERFGAANFGVDTLMVPAAAVEQIIDSTEIRAELDAAKAKIDFYMTELAKRDHVIQDKDKRLEELHEKIQELSERAARAEGQLAEIERQRQVKPRRWLGG